MGRKILFVTTDQQRYDTLGLQRRHPVAHAGVDGLAADGRALRPGPSPVGGVHAVALDHRDRPAPEHPRGVDERRARCPGTPRRWPRCCAGPATGPPWSARPTSSPTSTPSSASRRTSCPPRAPRPTAGPAVGSSTSRRPPTGPWGRSTTASGSCASTPRRSGCTAGPSTTRLQVERGRRRRHRRPPGQGQPDRPRDLPHRLGGRPDDRLARLGRRRRGLVLLDELPRPAPPVGPAGVRGRPDRLAGGAAAGRLPRGPGHPRGDHRRQAPPLAGLVRRHAGVQLRGAGRLGAGHAHRRPGPRGQRPQRRRGRAHRRGAGPGAGPRWPSGAGRTTWTWSFTTDHGELQGDFGLLFKGPYHVDALMRLPLVWRPAPSSPGRGARPGRWCTRPVGLVDLAPTFCAIAGIEPPGVDAGPAAPGRRRRRRRPGVRQGAHRVGQRALRHRRPPAHHDRATDGWSRAYLPGTSHDGTEGELYDLVDDPLQQVQPVGRPGRAVRSATTWWPTCGTPSPRSGPSGSSSRRRCEPRPRARPLLAGPVAGRGRRAPPAAGPRGRRRAARRRSPARRSTCVSRTDPMVTMAVTRDPGEVFLLRHTPGSTTPCSFVERIDPRHARAAGPLGDLAGGAMWPGGLAAHANGSLYVVFGNHAHRLAPDLAVAGHRRAAAAPALQRLRGPARRHAGDQGLRRVAARRAPVAPDEREPCELVALDPATLTVLDTCELAEPSIARLSADGDHVYVVGDTSLLRVPGGTAGSCPTTGSAPRTGPWRARPTAGTACWPSGRPGSSTTATARSTSTAPSGARGSPRPRSTWSGSTWPTARVSTSPRSAGCPAG